ncbi:glycosyltransferase [Siminovitchia fortis]|uniref:glycosyltransferase n=2 Tax=Bacillales TaxID=1385 RepID=UPI0011A3C960|nr:glycosyltransferase [Siminovitchia fortis]
MDYQLVKKVTKRRVNVLLNPISNFLKNKDIRNRSVYAKFYEQSSVKDNVIFYESRDGQSMTDNPYAIFKYILENKEWKNFVHVWSISDKALLKSLKEKYKKHSNVHFVLRMTRKYFYYLASSKYLINNSTFPNLVTIKPEQVYINTWHGTPLKQMGYDIPGQLMGPSNIVRNFLSSDYIISPNPFTTSVFERGFKLKGLYNGTILEEGYPRIDLTVNTDKDEVKEFLARYGIVVGDKKIILYAPTWKGNRISEPRDDVEQILNDMSKLEEKFGASYKVLIKVHPFLYKFASSNPLLKDYLVPDSIDTNELLSITDILITDYSSIFFDFLVTKKPILFYMWDYDDYKSNRGMYIEVDQLPGPISTSLESLIDDIQNIESIKQQYKKLYTEFIEKYCNNDYGNVTKNIVNLIFKDKNISKTEEKEKILIYPGGLKNNGITGAALSLLENIDYERYDVTLLVNFTNNQEVISNMHRVNPKARLAFKIGRINSTILDNYRNYITKNRGLTSPLLEKIYPSKMFEREFRRIFGKSKFDYVIDFSGYSMFWPCILLAGESKKKMIYMHSDLYSDMNREVNGRRPHYINLRGVFSLYKYFDELISVSEATMNLNKKNLDKFIGTTKITYIKNSINPQKIKEQSNDTADIYYQENKPVMVSVRPVNKGNFDIFNIPIPENEEGIVSFVNMGRLSPEKGQDQLIEAFALLHKEKPNTRLYIIGEGPVRRKLENLILELDLQNHVFLTGHRSNPFNLMSKCDAFVLSSHYEGQPLVLLESLTLGLPTIATDIIANRYVLEDGKYGVLVENSVDGIYRGMLSVVDQKVKQVSFNPEEYNKEAMASFYKTLDV